MNDQRQISQYISYIYSCPYKTAYRTFNPPASLTPYLERLVEGQASLHFRVPFCARKCGYRSLLSQRSCDGGRISAYLRTIRRQAEQLSVAAQDLEFTSSAVGGGTPLILNEKQLDELFCIAELFDVRPSEIFTPIKTSLEYVDKRVLQQLRARGVERLSMGVQSFNDAELKRLKGRLMSAIVIDALQNIRKADLSQSNLSLIYGIKGRTVGSFTHSLTTAFTCYSDELFIYPLCVRSGTCIDVCSTDDMCYVIYRSVHELLVEQEFVQTSIRRLAKRKTVELEFSCSDGTMLSCGSGGRSYLGNLHYATPYAARQEAIAGEIDRYTRTADSLTVTNGYLLSAEEVRIRFVMKNLMYHRGLGTAGYERRFGKEPDGTLFREFVDQGWIEEENRVLPLTEEGVVYSDYIGQSFVSSVVGRLMSEYIYPWSTLHDGGFKYYPEYLP